MLNDVIQKSLSLSLRKVLSIFTEDFLFYQAWDIYARVLFAFNHFNVFA